MWSLFCLGGGGDEGEAVVAQTGVPESGVPESGVSQSGIAKVSGVAEVVDGVRVAEVSGVGDGGGGHHGGGGGDGQGGGLGQHVHGGGRLLGSQTAGGGVVESGLESSLSGGHVLNVVEVGGGDLGGLDVVVDGVVGVGPQGRVLPSLGGGEGHVEGGLGGGHLGGVLKGSGGGQRQDGQGNLGIGGSTGEWLDWDEGGFMFGVLQRSAW